MADDHAILRDGIKQLFALTPDIVVAGEAVDGDQVMALISKDSFDIVLLDMSMPGPSGTDLIEQICACNSKLPILVLTMYDEPQIAKMALRAGASGYLTKDCETDILLSAVRKVSAGGRCVISKLAVDIALGVPESPQYESLDQLSDRELQILKLLAAGNGINDIANKLAIGRGTVSTYKTRLMRKMHFRNNAELILYAVQQGLAL